MREPQDQVDLRSAAASEHPDEAAANAADPPHAAVGRPWIALQFRCCHTYGRIYRNADATAYHGRCPRCGRPIRVRVGPGGVNTRFFEAL